MHRAALALLILAACFMPEPPGAACVPGQAAQCWCDGATPGVQACGLDGTYEPCVCEDTGTGEPPGSFTTSEGSSTDPDPSADTTAGAGSTTEPADSSSTSEGSTSIGEPPPTECTDMDFAFWQACHSLAYYENPNPCGPCFGANSCEIAQCSIDCTALGNPDLDAALAACDAEYPLCPDVVPPPSPYNACTAACAPAMFECLAALLPACDPATANACIIEQGECYTACQDKA